MASIAIAENKNPDQSHPFQQQSTIPLLTVYKNNAILKNIFILNNQNDDHGEHTLLIGRHPDCNIVLTHPSISRFHLQIRSTPSSRSLSLLDLSSVHGTWVNGTKLEPGESVDLKEGDTFSLGVSTRVYRLRWVPLARALDSQNSFFSELDVVEEEQQEVEEEQVELVKDVSFCTGGTEEIQPVDLVPEGNDALLLEGNLEPTVKMDTPLPHGTVPFGCDEERNSQSKDETSAVLNGPSGTETSDFPTNFDGASNMGDCKGGVVLPPYLQSVDEVDNRAKMEACPEVEVPQETNLFCTLKEYLTENICLPVVETVQGTKMQEPQDPPRTCTAQLSPNMHEHCFTLVTNIDAASFDEKGATVVPEKLEFECIVSDTDNIGARILNSENTCLPVGEVTPDSKFHLFEIVEEVCVDSLADEEYKSKLQDQNAECWHEGRHSLDEIIEDIGNKCRSSSYPVSLKGESLNSSVPMEAILENTNETENQTLQSLNAVAGCSEMEIHEICVAEIENSKYCQGNPLDHTIENVGHKCTGSICPISLLVNSVNSPMPQEADLIITGKKDNQTAQSLIAVAGWSEMGILESCVEATEKVKCCHEQGRSQDDIVQNIGNNCTGCTCPISFQVEPVNSSVPQESVLNITDKKENQTPQSLVAVAGCSKTKFLQSHAESTKKSSTCGNIWSRSGKAASAPQLRTRKSRLSRSNVDTEDEMGNEKDIIHKSMLKDLFSVLDEEEEIFTPDKENLSPNTLQLRFMRKKGMLEENKHSRSPKSHNSKVNFSPDICPGESISRISNKENQTLKVAQEQKSRRKPLECHMNLAPVQVINELKKNRVERVPFQSLMNSGGKCKSGTAGPVFAAESMDASNCGQILEECTKPSHISAEQMRRWVMVVDTASLLNKESRKALQLLQGLKWTRLIIPRLVIRELDSMKGQHRVFRRTSEASLVLEWIEECLENTKWWIHVQSSTEEHRLVAPTSPTSPPTQFPGPKESASPMVEDHILECTLLLRRKENDGQLVLLSDDVTLKIKSMAEGLLCESVQEFRQSLVNPFSQRFMWANSSPRGLTWSCQDDVILREKYCGLPSKAGLKLITEQFLYF